LGSCPGFPGDGVGTAHAIAHYPVGVAGLPVAPPVSTRQPSSNQKDPCTDTQTTSRHRLGTAAPEHPRRQAGPANEQEAALAPAAPVTWLPNSQNGDPQQQNKPWSPQGRSPQARPAALVGGRAGRRRPDPRAGATTRSPSTRAESPTRRPCRRRRTTSRSTSGCWPTAAAVPARSLPRPCSAARATRSSTPPEFVETGTCAPRHQAELRLRPAAGGRRRPRGPHAARDRTGAAGRRPRCDVAAPRGIGGVTIKDVVGIDANGVRIQGSLRYDSGALELRLPMRRSTRRRCRWCSTRSSAPRSRRGLDLQHLRLGRRLR